MAIADTPACNVWPTTASIPRRVNYLHRGDALPVAVHLPASGIVPKHDRGMLLSRCRTAALQEVLRGYGTPRSSSVSIGRLRGDVAESRRARTLFNQLGCRGFSYSVWPDVDVDDHGIRPDVNL